MASHVTVIGTDLRRATVKVTPGTYMTDVLQEACKKLGLPADKYLLKHKQKNVDLSIVWRQAGLSPGAKLELVQKSKTPSAVSVALQLPPPESSVTPNGRLVEKLPSDLSVWQVLRQFESGNASQGKNLNLTARGVANIDTGAKSGSGQLYYETPVLNIMGRELASFSDFQKTLSQLGYNSGSVLMRLSFRLTEKTLYEAMSEISQHFPDVETPRKEPTTASSASTAMPAPTLESEDTAKEPSESTAPAASTEQSHSVGGDTMDVDYPGPSDPLQPVGVFQAPTGTTPAAALAAVSETDFSPTVAHAQLHQIRLQQASQNKRLLSDKELEDRANAEKARLASVSSVAIKVRFPDNTSAQWSFGPEATGALLYKAVRSVMAHDSQPFKLVLPGTRTIITNSDNADYRLVHNYKLTRNVLVNFIWDSTVSVDVRKQPFLKGSIAQQAKAVQVPDIPQEADDSKESGRAVQPSKPESNDRTERVAKKLPKWFKLPGKK
ncbi:hypothetical protein SODALDRAFT_343916 [Sodiomyces alkalinus F11]|uniref:TUG ubiquitin-like domain-containing protein n=1 Tax=Sodiomyces alkalinus (strain CBS 110278 / VKM F-3762 / F11) TaxID=1314773 RepID=A0A3N2PZT9_SODAK|nr:hypothetical protein SODALDRAFT_343916 [Sodiomyces alkalinus F11]ROT40039.1 hypothetical protein SODALDRAFT_343916 [Sodiomyces alkalinus F11]